MITTEIEVVNHNQKSFTFRKLGNVVSCTAFFENSSVAHHSIVCNIPVNFRPKYTTEMPLIGSCAEYVNSHLANIDVLPNGDMKVFTKDAITLTDVSFRIQTLWIID